ncbi:MAG TPA: BBP7 family outer membrane beta-barrel protein [Gemmatales bacterium]|nr:BBP7 family outer membrane beta-barrel protein [Gemmatales bacterium]
MKRRDWLTLALIGCSAPLAALNAQDTKGIPVPPSTGKSSELAKPVEPGTRTPSVKEGTGTQTGGAPASGTADPSSGSVNSDDYRPSFSERMSGFGDVFRMPTFNSWGIPELYGATGNALPGDVDDPSWFKMEMLFGRFKSASVTPMLTTSLPQSSQGILGNDGTSVLFGDSVSLQTHYGFKVTGGFWTEPSQQLGFEGSYFQLFGRSVGVSFNSKGDPLLAAPYLDALTNQQASVLFANEASDSLIHRNGYAILGIDSSMQGAELNIMQNLVRGPRGRLDWSWGYRYLRFDENLFDNFFSIQDAQTGQAYDPRFYSFDEFRVQNEFQGFNASLRSQWWWGGWSLDLTGKLGLGAIRNSVYISGSRFSATPPAQQFSNTNGGVYALASNIGDTTIIRFSVAPEIEVGVGYQICDGWRFMVNYDFLALTNVMRAGDQVDNRINPNILDGNGGNPAVPAPLNKTSTFWLQTFSFGLEYRW